MEHFDVYIHKVLKQVHPDTRISHESLALMNFIVNFLCVKIAHKAVMLVNPLNYESKKKTTTTAKKTISSRDIQAAVRLLLEGELPKHAVSSGTKAVTKYTSFHPKSEKPTTAAEKAGLQFSVSRTSNLLRRNISLRVGETASVYLAAVLEYICAEILELAGNNSKDHKMKTIMPRHMKEIVVEDKELHRLMRDLHVILPGVKDQPHNKKHAMYNESAFWVM